MSSWNGLLTTCRETLLGKQWAVLTRLKSLSESVGRNENRRTISKGCQTSGTAHAVFLVRDRTPDCTDLGVYFGCLVLLEVTLPRTLFSTRRGVRPVLHPESRRRRPRGWRASSLRPRCSGCVGWVHTLQRSFMFPPDPGIMGSSVGVECEMLRLTLLTRRKSHTSSYCLYVF